MEDREPQQNADLRKSELAILASPGGQTTLVEAQVLRAATLL
jgi:hypothetical protein